MKRLRWKLAWWLIGRADNLIVRDPEMDYASRNLRAAELAVANHSESR